MLGEEDHEVLADDAINPVDLFGEEDTPLLPPLEEDAETGAADTTTDRTGEKKRRAPINRLPNLNEKWLTDPKMEGLHKVNEYFKDVHFKEGKGQDRRNLKHLLKRYEYWAQQCYPKLCFQDFVEKVEALSGKKLIKHSIQEIRRNISNSDVQNNDLDDDEENTDLPTQPVSDDNHSSIFDAPVISNTNATVPAKSPSPPPMTDDIREMIRRKREEALAKRKRKLDESFNTSKVDVQLEVNKELQSEEGVSATLSDNVGSENKSKLKNISLEETLGTEDTAASEFTNQEMQLDEVISNTNEEELDIAQPPKKMKESEGENSAEEMIISEKENN